MKTLYYEFLYYLTFTLLIIIRIPHVLQVPLEQQCELSVPFLQCLSFVSRSWLSSIVDSSVNVSIFFFSPFCCCLPELNAIRGAPAASDIKRLQAMQMGVDPIEPLLVK